MGLKSADHGVKSILTSRYHQAFRRCDSIGQLRQMTGSSRDQTVIVADGNVLLAQTPQSVGSFEDYVRIVFGMLKTLMGSASIVSVVFDEPANLTRAKYEEQSKRDAQRNKRAVVSSGDFGGAPDSDDYRLSDIQTLADCHPLVSCRAARQRFFDAVCAEVMNRMKATIAKWKEQGHQSALIFDGLDARGADREFGDERQAVVWGSDPQTTALFQRHDGRIIGEGDLKLAFWEGRVRELVSDESLQTKLFIQSTIDTDSFAITLNDVAARAVQGMDEAEVKGCLVMRERAYKRGVQDSDAKATYLCCDYAQLHEYIQKDMWSVVPCVEDQLLATRFLTTCWAACGSDFVEIKGMRADHVMQNIRPLITECPHLIAPFANVADGSDECVIKAVTPALKRMVYMCAGDVKRKNQAEEMRRVAPELLARAAWICSYWVHNEQKNTRAFGFSF